MTTFAVIDCETTGVDPAVDRVVEVARVLVDVKQRLVLGHDEWRFSPGDRGLPPEARAIHHLSPEDLAGCPEYDRGRWWPSLGRNVDEFAAHNATFDRGFLVPESEQDSPWICTMKCARVAWPEAPGYGNQVLRYWRNIDPALPPDLHPHRAAYDAIVTAHLLVQLVEAFDGDLVRMARVTEEPSLLRTIGFGKYRGTLWADAPRSYLQWILSQDFGPDEKHTARHHLGAGTP